MVLTINLNAKGGFTLIEIVIVLAIIAVLAGILTPTLTRYVGDSRITRTEADIRNIAAATAMMYGDTGLWPIWSNGTATKPGDTKFNILVSGDGDKPEDNAGLTSNWPTAASDDIEDQLIDNVPNYPRKGRRGWRGPYLERVRADAWGNKYMVNVKFLHPAQVDGTKPCFVLSAGPNRLVETNFEQSGPGITIGGDDIVFRIK